ncbi:uncharacterized protein LOC122093127 [Macadamia integrifolia]|uniref:uncharacterized protein LOC122093127 n=1 Tax=Macadamia integrifolia TaxID=60698 RepID=UPI001C533D7D|nr:uncharacterized protein LOC122093127 [Macadamia integrifolia]
MAEEFQESDVLWPEQSYRREDRFRRKFFQDENFDPAEMIFNNNNSVACAQQNTIQLRRKKSKQSSSQSHSLPVNIPCNWNSNRFGSSNNNPFLHCSDSKESEDDLEDAEMVPPHLIVANRFARQMAFSVCTGNGRTLKGRDLRRVRNSILRMTGFLET